MSKLSKSSTSTKYITRRIRDAEGNIIVKRYKKRENAIPIKIPWERTPSIISGSISGAYAYLINQYNSGSLGSSLIGSALEDLAYYQTKIDNMSKHNVGNLFDVRSIAKSRQLQDQKNFYSVEQSLSELEELLQSTRLYSFKEKTTDLIKRISGRDGDSYTIREMGKFISELVNELKLKYEVKE